jgi:ferritin-like metal-binding protein YciE
MFERLHTPEEAFNWRLGATLKMEREIVDMLDELIEKSHDEALQQALRKHQGETRGHIENVEHVFHLFEWDVDDSPCPVVEALEKEGKANIKKADDAVVDSIILAGATETEHHEIAVYENLIINAQALGREDAAEILKHNLDEEHAALEKVTSLARQTAASTPRQPV